VKNWAMWQFQVQTAHMREAIIRAVLGSVPSNGALIGIFKQTMGF